MTKHYITDNNGDQVKDSSGNPLFWYDHDGDRNPNRQTVFDDTSDWLGSSNHKVDSHHDPDIGRFVK